MAKRIGLVGYGAGGRWFHAPYLVAAPDLELAGVVTRSAARSELVARDLDGVPVYPSMAALAAEGIDAVVISTPPETRGALVREAIALGLHVVADKPFAPSAADAQELVDAAAEAGVLLNVFHNRRYDTDFVTARGVRDSGALGEISRLDLRFDLDEPGSLEGGPTGGLLRDLGTHLVDQAMQLLGPVRSVHADLLATDTDQGPTDGTFVLAIEHDSTARSFVSASKLSRLSSRELRLHGTDGSYRSDYRDVQTAAILAGERPAGAREHWGFESEDRWGWLAVADGTHRVPSAQGDYTRFYDAFAEAMENGGPGPVPGDEGVAVLRVLDAARRSAELHTSVTV